MAKTKNLPKSSKLRAATLVVFALVIGVLGYAILYQGRAAVPAAPTVYLTPETATLAQNTTFNVSVYENSGTSRVLSAGVQFSYPQELVDFVSIDSNSSPFVTQVISSGGNGIVTIGRGTNTANNEAGALTGTQLLGIVTFRTKTTSGVANLTPLLNDSTTIITASDFSNPATYSNLITAANRIQGSVVTIDATAPTVSLSGITNSQVISNGSTVPVTVTASDNTGITAYDIYVDGVLKQTIPSTTSPYVYQWNTTGLSLANHTFQARAKDAYGNTGQSATITVAVADRTAPTVSLTAPTSPVKGTVTLTATATDNTGGTGVARVEFYSGSTLIGQDTSSPYQASWNTTSGSFPDGSYSLTAKAYDNTNPVNSATSTAVNVTVENTDRVAPSAPTNLRVSATGPTSASIAWNASTDNVGVTGYRVSRNGGTAVPTTSLTLNDTGLTPGTAYNYSVTAVDAAGNVSSAATVTATTTTAKVGDFNLDGIADLVDLGIMINRWGTTDTTCDINKDGSVTLMDLAIFIAFFKK